MSRTLASLTAQLGTHQAARTMVLFYLAGASTALLDVHVLRSGAALDPVVRGQVTLLALLELAVAAVLWLLPWHRWPRTATLPLVIWTLMLHAGFGLTGFMSPAVSVAFTTAGFVWMGVFHTYRATLVLSVPAAVTYALPLWWLDGDPRHVATLVIVLPVWLLIAYVITRTVSELRHTHQRLDRRAQLLEQVAHAGRQLNQLHPDEVTAAALDTLRDIGASPAALVLHLDSGGPTGHLMTQVTEDDTATPDSPSQPATPRALTPTALEGLQQHLDQPHSPGMTTLTEAVTVNEVELPAGQLLAHAPLSTLNGHGSLIAVYPPDQPPGHTELQAIQLLANQTGQALSTAHLFQSERRESRRHATDARRDGLTGIGNRRVIDAALEDLRPGDVVVMLDLDLFKQVNDDHGHAAGDDTLRQLATYLQGFARNQDTVGRYGGEEFTLVLAQAAREADGALDRLLDGWRAELPVTTLSAGYAIHTHGCTPADTLAAADAALYRAKQGGRDRAVHGRFDATMAADARTLDNRTPSSMG